MNKQIKQRIANIAYAWHMRFDRTRIQVLSIDDTICEVRKRRLSLIRFGDGEILLMRGRSLRFQEATTQLSSDLLSVLRAQDEGLLIAIPDIFDGMDQYIPSTESFWKDHLLFSRSIYYKNCNPSRQYGNAFFSRCYFMHKDRSQSGKWFEEIRQIWAGRDVTIVEGAGSHTGVTNDLLDTAASVERILCPPRKAYDSYAEILAACRQIDQNRMVLLAIGPSAKPLGLALFHQGYRVLDIGNLDTEYEWFLQGATEKVQIPKQSVLTIEENERLGYTQYLSEVVQRVGC